jgi:hypothetical protein
MFILLTNLLVDFFQIFEKFPFVPCPVNYIAETEHSGQVVSTAGLYLGGPGFESQSRDHLF